MPPRIVLASDGRVLAHEVFWAKTRRERKRGLLDRPPLGDGEALVIPGAFQVHTFGMDYPIDVVFCGSDWTVKHVARGLRPRRLSRLVSARYAIEVSEGGADGVYKGDRLIVG